MQDLLQTDEGDRLMANLSIRHLSSIRAGTATPQQYGEAFADVENAVNNVGTQTNSAPVGMIPAPQQHASLTVLGGNGIMDVAIGDDSKDYRGKEHFFDYSTDNFLTFHTKSLGPAKNWRGTLGKGVFQVRSYASFATSSSSPFLSHLTDIDTTTATEPAMQNGQGSGTGISGYGDVPYNAVVPPKRA